MTIEAGVKLDIAGACDDLLEFLYQRRGGSVNINEIELDYRTEYIETAANKLEAEGHIEVFKTRGNWFYKITPRGQVQYRTSSFVQEQTNQRKAKRFVQIKNIAEILFGIATVALTFYTFTLGSKVDEQEKEIESLRSNLARQKGLNDELIRQVGQQETEILNVVNRLHVVETDIKETKIENSVP